MEVYIDAPSQYVWTDRASQDDLSGLSDSGLASMYSASMWSALLRAPMDMDIRARCFSLAVRLQRAIVATRFVTRRSDRFSICQSISQTSVGTSFAGLLLLSKTQSSRLRRQRGLIVVAMVQHAPGDTRQLVGKRDGENVAV